MTVLRLLRKTEMQVHRMRGRCMYRISEGTGLHPGQPPLLRVISEMGACTQKEIANKLDCSAASIAVSLKRLENSGYIKKEASKTDLRYNTITLTENGKRVVGIIESNIDKLDEITYADFSGEEIAQFSSFLERARVNLENYYAKLTEESDHD